MLISVYVQRVTETVFHAVLQTWTYIYDIKYMAFIHTFYSTVSSTNVL